LFPATQKDRIRKSFLATGRPARDRRKQKRRKGFIRRSTQRDAEECRTPEIDLAAEENRTAGEAGISRGEIRSGNKTMEYKPACIHRFTFASNVLF
jgi:hypothetical protein